MDLIAHRGLTNNKINENTIKSFQNAINNNYQGIEIDLRKTKDNKIVVLHDYFINRTSNGIGSIKKYTYKELLKYNFGLTKKQETIPLLKEIINKFNNIVIILELKEKFSYKEINEILLNNKTNDYYITSFNKSYLKPFINNNYKVGIISTIFKINNIKQYNFIIILEDIFNKNIYNILKNNNIEVILYGLFNSINIKNKEILGKIKYII